MANTSDIKNGLCIKHNHDLFQIIEFQHVKPGKGAAFVRTKLRSLTSGKVLDNTFNAGVKIETINIERRKYQFLYKDDIGFHLMNTENFEQISLEGNMVESPEFLQEGMEVEILFHADEEKALTLDLPQFIEAEITYTEPGVKGDTATNAMKPATIDSGAEVRVPLFINQGDRIKVDTRTKSYAERVK